mgnify:CR=1 FL=1
MVLIVKKNISSTNDINQDLEVNNLKCDNLEIQNGGTITFPPASIPPSSIQPGTVSVDDMTKLSEISGDIVDTQRNQNIGGDKVFINRLRVSNNEGIQLRNDSYGNNNLGAHQLEFISNQGVDECIRLSGTDVNNRAFNNFCWGTYTGNNKANPWNEKFRLNFLPGTANSFKLFADSDEILNYTTLGSSVVNSSLTSVGDLTGLVLDNGGTATQIQMNGTADNRINFNSAFSLLYNQINPTDFEIKSGANTVMRLNNNGVLGIGINPGTSFTNVVCNMDSQTGTRGFLPPKFTNAQRAALSSIPEGLLIYNEDSNHLEYYNGTGWDSVGSHENSSSNIHGINGSILGTTDIQDITNKSLIEVDNIRIDGNKLDITNTNGNLELQANGTGHILASSNIRVPSNTLIQLRDSTTSNDSSHSILFKNPGGRECMFINGSTPTVNTQALCIGYFNNNDKNDTFNARAEIDYTNASNSGRFILEGKTFMDIDNSNLRITTSKIVSESGQRLTINPNSQRVDILNTAGLTISDNPTSYSTSYTCSIQTNTNDTWLEILNNQGTNKGAFFGVSGNNFQMWNYQGGDIQFFVSPTVSNGVVKLTLQNNGELRIHDLPQGFVKTTTNGTLFVQPSTSDVVDLIATQTLTNKTIDFNNNTLNNVCSISSSQTLTNKTIDFNNNTLNNVCSISTSQTLTNKTFTDNVTTFQDNADNSKKIRFDLSLINSGTTRTLQLPDEDGPLIGSNSIQTISNKIINNTNTVNLTSLTSGTCTLNGSNGNQLFIDAGSGAGTGNAEIRMQANTGEDIRLQMVSGGDFVLRNESALLDLMTWNNSRCQVETGNLDILSGVLEINGTQVLKQQEPAISNPPADKNSNNAAIISILGALRNHGIISS